MCCLYGLLDTQNRLSGENKTKLLHLLALAAEVRGTDASGAAYHAAGRLVVRKAPVPGHKLRFQIPDGTGVIMGHARLTTQGNEKINRNNHPFRGKAGNRAFALAHNGVIWNDRELRERLSLPETTIETDSYIAVQLIEQKRTLDFSSLKYMAEQVEGSFTFTVLDAEDGLYFVKGDSPISIYRFPKLGLYFYASTAEILVSGLRDTGLHINEAEKIGVRSGEILRIDRDGAFTRGNFDDANLHPGHWQCCWTRSNLTELEDAAAWMGYPPELADRLLRRGYSTHEIEEILYNGEI